MAAQQKHREALLLADQDDSDEDCIDDDNSSDLEDGELEVRKKAKSATRKIFPDEDDCEGIDDSDEDEEEESLEDDDYAIEDDDSAKRDDSESSKDKDETEIQDKLIEATLKQEAEQAKAEDKKD